MKPAPFQYHAPTTIAETLDLLAQHAGDDGRVLAGGQSLVPTMAFRLARPRHLVDINGVAELNRIKIDNGRLCIGASVRHAAFEKPVEPGPLGRLLAMVVRHIGHGPIRARGTFCGSIAHADPASEWCAVAAALDAEMIAESRAGGMRAIPAREFFAGIMTTALRDDELLREVRLPLLANETRVGFAEFSRRAGDFAIAMAVVAYGEGEARIGLGGVEAAPRRIAAAERALAGPDSFVAVSRAIEQAVDPLEDANISADYRRSLAGAMVRRALENASAP
jgi:carbon-monoxide dehydrogenase medium subunit